MKRITFIFLIGILFFTTGQAQNKKEIRIEKEFQKTLALVNSIPIKKINVILFIFPFFEYYTWVDRKCYKYIFYEKLVLLRKFRRFAKES